MNRIAFWIVVSCWVTAALLLVFWVMGFMRYITVTPNYAMAVRMLVLYTFTFIFLYTTRGKISNWYKKIKNDG